MKKRKRSDRIYFEREIVKSKAWFSLGGASPQVYLVFKSKCQYARPNGCNNWKLTNNGQIEFSYVEAKRSYGVAPSRFRRAIDDLIDKGFIDIAGTGMGVHKVLTYYSISERWKSYGEPTFVPSKRPLPTISNPGFKKGNKLFLRRLSSVENEHGTVFENVVVTPLAVFENVVVKIEDKSSSVKELSS